MPDRKKSSSIFSFNKKQKSFLKGALVFFIPVIVVYAVLEILVLQIPFSYNKISDYLNAEGKNIKILTIGSSQMRSALNPKFLDEPAINFGSTQQHHNTDYDIITQTRDRLEKLEYVVLELSYSHLELPHNSNFFWKNNIYLKYYDVNTFDRRTYFKDKLIYISKPNIYSKALINHYLKKNNPGKLNKYGFDENYFDGIFKKTNYIDSLNPIPRKIINTNENPFLFKANTKFFLKMLDYLRSENLKVIVVTTPMHTNYLKNRNPNILKRRDSILAMISAKYSNVRIFSKEEDTITFSNKDLYNWNHLNPIGAEKFTSELNTFIKEQFPN